MQDFPATLAVIARRQHGLFTMAQAAQCGLNRKGVEALVRCGLLQRIDRALLRSVVVPQCWEADVLRYVLIAGPGAVASHRCAARLWGIEDFTERTPELTVPRGRRVRREGARVHESTDLDRTDVVIRSGVPTTDLARTILDLARRTSDDRLALAVQWCRRERGLSWAQLAAVLRRHARGGRPGIRPLRALIAREAHRDEVSDSTFEELFIALMLEHGLPEPVLHLRVTAAGPGFELDLAYPDLKLAIELDGAIHMQPTVFRNDRRRQNVLVLDGWFILRFTWDDFCTRPERIIQEINAAIEARSVA